MKTTKILWQDNNKDERHSFLGKEKDEESDLGDYGVRKYDDLTGRFTATDPLWEKYYGWSPYVYSANNPVNLKDINGKLPGDAFSSPEIAAHDFGKNYNFLSIEHQKEFGSYIYRSTDKNGENFYTYLTPIEGDVKSVNLSPLKQVLPKNSVIVSVVHSHANFDKLFESNIFSKQDLRFANQVNLDSYVSTPNGKVIKYDPITERISTIFSDLPRDPSDPQSKLNSVPVGINNENRHTPFYNNEGHYQESIIKK